LSDMVLPHCYARDHAVTLIPSRSFNSQPPVHYAIQADASRANVAEVARRENGMDALESRESLGPDFDPITFHISRAALQAKSGENEMSGQSVHFASACLYARDTLGLAV
jgi:hypothetical protein